MKRNQLIGIALMCILIGCRNEKQNSKQNNPDTNITSENSFYTKGVSVESDTIKYEYKYFFSNDTISQTLYIKKGAMSKKNEVPEMVNFKIVLNDKSKPQSEKIVSGKALLTSANESFFDKNDIDGGDYFAADYISIIKGCELKIRLDIDKYSACVVSTTCIDMKDFFKNYSEYDVLKKVSYPK
jgi:hypothetical protein